MIDKTLIDKTLIDKTLIEKALAPTHGGGGAPISSLRCNAVVVL
ncbi:hypothetical protein QCM77_25305 [Bradyrhizobium sp. SSUT18]|nr:hypothetical protein [Bradyrhizobium sp. SSUT18]MDH2403239.1 hypothetical protein [Bradyrhizobium sp. SSUT18]